MSLMIAIPTYKRPNLLNQSIENINSQLSALKVKFSIHIYDNDELHSADVVVKKFSENVFYKNYPVKGLSNIRNKIISDFTESDFENLMMVDDDQIVDEDFFYNLFKSGIHSKFDIISSTVRPLFISERPEWTYNNSIYWDSENKRSGQVSIIYGAGCVILNSKIKKTRVRFNTFFNDLGGEDAAFFTELSKIGFSFYIADFLKTSELVDQARADYNWFLRRAIRIGVSEFFLNKLILKKNTFNQVAKSFFILIIMFPFFLLHYLLRSSILNKKSISFLRHYGRLLAVLGIFKNAY